VISQSSHEIRILHHGHLAVATQCLKEITPDKQTLVTVGEPEPSHAPLHTTLDQARLPAGRIDLETKTPTHHTSDRVSMVTIDATDFVEPSFTEPHVSMQEQQPSPGRTRCPGIHLSAAPRRPLRPQHRRPALPNLIERQVGATARNDHLESIIWLQLREQHRQWHGIS
jgi:hypothetical protein